MLASAKYTYKYIGFWSKELDASSISSLESKVRRMQLIGREDTPFRVGVGFDVSRFSDSVKSILHEISTSRIV